MAMAAVATPMTPSASLHPPTAATRCGSKHAVEQHHGSKANFVRRGAAAWDFSSSSCSSCRAHSWESASASDSSGLSSSGRDGGACCGLLSSSSVAAAVTTCSLSTPRSSGRSSHNADAGRLSLGWRACSGGFVKLNWSGLSAASSAGRRRNSAATPVPRRLTLRIAAEKPDLTNVAGTLLRLGKQGLETGTKLVPESVPRPVAQAGVGLAGVVLASFLLRSLFSTVTFILAIGALSYAGYFFLTKGDSNSSSGKGGDGSSDKSKSTDDALEEARRIMDKYK